MPFRTLLARSQSATRATEAPRDEKGDIERLAPPGKTDRPRWMAGRPPSQQWSKQLRCATIGPISSASACEFSNSLRPCAGLQSSCSASQTWGSLPKPQSLGHQSENSHSRVDSGRTRHGGPDHVSPLCPCGSPLMSTAPPCRCAFAAAPPRCQVNELLCTCIKVTTTSKPQPPYGPDCPITH